MICFSFNSDLVGIWSFRANSTVRLGKPKDFVTFSMSVNSYGWPQAFEIVLFNGVAIGVWSPLDPPTVAVAANTVAAR